jgi:hypothetical protein
MTGPPLWLKVLTTLTIPITAVRSCGSMMAERNVDRGAWSIDAILERAARKNTVSPRDEGAGMSARMMADGR